MLTCRLVLAIVLVVVALGFSRPEPGGAEDTQTLVKVAILLASSGRGDKSYNDAALAGVASAKTKGAVAVQELLPTRPEEYNSFINRVVAAGVDLTVGVGFLYADPFRSASSTYREARFLILDSEIANMTNLRSVTFRADQGSFLAGVAAAAESRVGSIGFVGGMNIPIIQSFQCGYEAGARWTSKEMRKEIRSHAVYLGTTPDAFSNPARGRELTRSLIRQRKTDVVYHAAGASGNGVIDAAHQAGVKAIGVDTDQAHLAPGSVITSMLKRLDKAVERAIEDVRRGAFTGGVEVMNVANGGVDIVLPGLLNGDTRRLVDKARTGIASGAIVACAK